MTTTNPHTRPAIASAIGIVVGVLAMIQAYFGSGPIPTSAEVAGLLGGAGVSLGSVVAYIISHLGIVKALAGQPTAITNIVAPPVQPAPAPQAGTLAAPGIAVEPPPPVTPPADPATAGQAS